jgi:hypothetical protein
MKTRMKRLNLFFYCLLYLFIVTGGAAYSQVTPPVSAQGHVLAEIIPIFTASETTQLDFGRFSPGPQGGEIILTPESTFSVLGSVYKGSGSQNAASFYVTGDADESYTISLPSGPVLLTHTTTAKTLRVVDWVSVPAPGIGAGRLKEGFQIVRVGATLKVGTLYDNPIGIYTGSYTITFDFN